MLLVVSWVVRGKDNLSHPSRVVFCVPLGQTDTMGEGTKAQSVTATSFPHRPS